MALNQQRTADTNIWWENKFMAFFHLETYLTLMQILCQFSGEPAPQMDLHLTEEQGGAVPWALCWWALKVSGVLGKALGALHPACLVWNCNGSSLQCREFLAFEWGCCVWAQRDGNSFAVVVGDTGGSVTRKVGASFLTLLWSFWQ